MVDLPHAADRLHPPKDLLDEFPLLLADRVAGRPGGAAIDGAAAHHLGDVRCEAELTRRLDKRPLVEEFVGHHRAAPIRQRGQAYSAPPRVRPSRWPA